MQVAKFTAEETMDERKDIINKFSNGIDLQAIVDIKGLDEGDNIPAIRNQQGRKSLISHWHISCNRRL